MFAQRSAPCLCSLRFSPLLLSLPTHRAQEGKNLKGDWGGKNGKGEKKNVRERDA